MLEAMRLHWWRMTIRECFRRSDVGHSPSRKSLLSTLQWQPAEVINASNLALLLLPGAHAAWNGHGDSGVRDSKCLIVTLAGWHRAESVWA